MHIEHTIIHIMRYWNSVKVPFSSVTIKNKNMLGNKFSELDVFVSQYMRVLKYCVVYPQYSNLTCHL